MCCECAGDLVIAISAISGNSDTERVIGREGRGSDFLIALSVELKLAFKNVVRLARSWAAFIFDNENCDAVS